MIRRDPLANPEALIRRVYSYAAYRLGDGPDAEDVTSETFERALRYRDSFDPRRGDPAAWLVGIASRCVNDFLLKRPLLLREPVDVPGPQDVEQEASDRAQLAAALAELEERDRELVSLRYGADFTARQIGEVLGMTTNAVEVALHRTLGRLRRSLAADAEAAEIVAERSHAAL